MLSVSGQTAFLALLVVLLTDAITSGAFWPLELVTNGVALFASYLPFAREIVAIRGILLCEFCVDEIVVVKAFVSAIVLIAVTVLLVLRAVKVRNH